MITVKGKLSEIIKLDEINREAISLNSLINCPITFEGKCIGHIEDFNIKANEWKGYVYDIKTLANLFPISKEYKIASIEIIEENINEKSN